MNLHISFVFFFHSAFHETYLKRPNLFPVDSGKTHKFNSIRAYQYTCCIYSSRTRYDDIDITYTYISFDTNVNLTQVDEASNIFLRFIDYFIQRKNVSFFPRHNIKLLHEYTHKGFRLCKPPYN